jgi:hypothetical protein
MGAGLRRITWFVVKPYQYFTSQPGPPVGCLR